MPDFKYHASQIDGQMVHGILTAENQHHLVMQLQVKGLFLVSWNVVIPEEPVSTPIADQPTEAVSSGTRFDDRVDAKTPLTRKQKMLLFSILAGGIFMGVARAYLYRHPLNYHPKSSADLLNEKLARLHNGMTRAEIESFFTASSPGATDPDKSRYFVPPDYVVEIAYDKDGGQGTQETAIFKALE